MRAYIVYNSRSHVQQSLFTIMYNVHMLSLFTNEVINLHLQIQQENQIFTYFIHVAVSSILINKVVFLMKTHVLSNRPLKLQTVFCYLKFHRCVQKNRKPYAWNLISALIIVINLKCDRRNLISYKSYLAIKTQ